jgi:hypothetical protein
MVLVVEVMMEEEELEHKEAVMAVENLPIYVQVVGQRKKRVIVIN